MPYLNREPLDQLVAEAGLTFDEFAAECGITPVTLSRARHGRAMKPSTLRKLARGLSRLQKLKPLEGVVTVVDPNNKHAAAGKAAAQGGIANDPRHPVEA